MFRRALLAGPKTAPGPFLRAFESAILAIADHCALSPLRDGEEATALFPGLIT